MQGNLVFHEFKHWEIEPITTSGRFFQGKSSNGFPLVKPELLDHRDLMRNERVRWLEYELGNFEITKWTKREDIDHRRDKKNVQALMDNHAEAPDLAYWDKHKGPKAIVDKFLEYMDRCWANKKYLVADGTIVFNNGDTDEKTIWWEALNRYQSNRNVREVSELLEKLSKVEDKAIMLTLTFDPELRSQRESWESVAQDFHRFITRLKIEIAKEKGIKVRDLELPFIRVLEAQHDIDGENYGYAHIHVLFFGIDFLYWNGNAEEYQYIRSGNPIRKSIESFWKLGYTSVNKTRRGQNIQYPVNYMMKYVRKLWQQWTDEAILTKAMLWAFNKRTFDKSRNLKEYVENKVQKRIAAENTAIGDLVNLVKKYPGLWDMPETQAARGDLATNRGIEMTISNVAEAYNGLHGDEPIPDQAVEDFERLVNYVNNRISDDEGSEMEDKPKWYFSLVGMAQGFKPKRYGQPVSSRISSIVKIVERQSKVETKDQSEELEVYTTNNIPELQVLAGENRATKDQLKALIYLTRFVDHGLESVSYYRSVYMDPGPLQKYRELYEMKMNCNDKENYG